MQDEPQAVAHRPFGRALPVRPAARVSRGAELPGGPGTALQGRHGPGAFSRLRLAAFRSEQRHRRHRWQEQAARGVPIDTRKQTAPGLRICYSAGGSSAILTGNTNGATARSPAPKDSRARFKRSGSISNRPAGCTATYRAHVADAGWLPDATTNNEPAGNVQQHPTDGGVSGAALVSVHVAFGRALRRGARRLSRSSDDCRWCC